MTGVAAGILLHTMKEAGPGGRDCRPVPQEAGS